MLFMMNSDKKSWLEDIASPALVTLTSQNDGFSAMFKPFCLKKKYIFDPCKNPILS